MPCLRINFILFSTLNISALTKINNNKNGGDCWIATHKIHWAQFSRQLNQSNLGTSLLEPARLWLGCFCSPQASPAHGCTHLASKEHWAISDFALPASFSLVHFLQPRAALKNVSGDTLLAVGGWRAVSQANILTVLQNSISISGFGFATSNSPACSWRMTSAEVLRAEG